jgi:hypothetical protein
MEKAEMITREEAEQSCAKMATSLREGIRNEIHVLHEKLFSVAVYENELEPVFNMAGSYLETILMHLDGTLGDIEGGLYLPRKEA